MAVTPLELSSGAVEEATGRRSGVTLYLLWGLFWLLMTVVAVQDYLQAGRTMWWEPVLWEGSSAAAATVWLLLQRRFDATYAVHLDRPARWFAHHFKWLPLVAITFIAAVYGVRHGAYALLGYPYRHDPWGFVIGYESIKLTLFVGLWLGILFGFGSYAKWQEQRRRLLELQKSLAESRLAHLSAQLRPHFFFNALNTISALLHIDAARADRLVARLGDLLRTSLRADERETNALEEELRLLELYAGIMIERFGERVSLEWSIDRETLTVSVPILITQPLLENTFRHGVERTSAPVRIEIASRREGASLVISVRNGGMLLAGERSEGVGLRNCRERLAVMYGDAGRLDLVQLDAATVEARLVLPWNGPDR